MTTLAFTRTGAGEPLVLLHGIGLSRGSWDPVVPALAARFDVVAVDLPGFGDSAPLPPGVEPEPAAMARAVAELLDRLGLVTPHVAGNSLGGWVALELAGLRPVASLSLLSPAGLWRDRTPLYCRASLRATRWLCRHLTGPLTLLVSWRPARTVILVQVLGRPGRMRAEQARAAVRAIGTCPGFDPTLRATADRRYRSGAPVEAPVTVAFGSRDRVLLRRQSRHLDQLPAGTRVAGLPRCGHVPMSDDPAAVAALLASSTARRSTSDGGAPRRRGGQEARSG